MTVRSSNVFFFFSAYFGTLRVGYIPFFFKSLYFSWTRYFVYLNL